VKQPIFFIEFAVVFSKTALTLGPNNIIIIYNKFEVEEGDLL
jgi:hypothetical protein